MKRTITKSLDDLRVLLDGIEERLGGLNAAESDALPMARAAVELDKARAATADALQWIVAAMQQADEASNRKDRAS